MMLRKKEKLKGILTRRKLLKWCAFSKDGAASVKIERIIHQFYKHRLVKSSSVALGAAQEKDWKNFHTPGIFLGLCCSIGHFSFQLLLFLAMGAAQEQLKRIRTRKYA
jgi:hypothetical protein